MRITPLRNMVLVTLDETSERRTESGLALVELAKQPSMYATVEAVGPEVREARVGARVVVSRLQGIEVLGRVLLPEGAILATTETQADGAT